MPGLATSTPLRGRVSLDNHASMTSPPLPGFFERFSLALRVLGDPALAARVRDGAGLPGGALPVDALPGAELPRLAEKGEEKVIEKIVERVVEKPVERIVEKTVEKIVERTRIDPEAGALHVLALLQRDGRLVDFLQEDIAGAGDADVGAAARVVHSGCRKALQQYFTLEPVRSESEGAGVTVDKGFDPNLIRLSGNVAGEPPFKGKLAHAGWRAKDVKLPDRPAAVDARVVAPAEVEIP